MSIYEYSGCALLAPILHVQILQSAFVIGHQSGKFRDTYMFDFM